MYYSAINVNIVRRIVSIIFRKPLVQLVDFDGETNIRMIRNVIYVTPGTEGPYKIGICKRMFLVPQSDCVLFSDGTVKREDGSSHYVKKWHLCDRMNKSNRKFFLFNRIIYKV